LSAPKKNMAAAAHVALGARINNGRVRQKPTAQTVVTARLPKRLAMPPAKGSAHIAPTAIASSTEPSCPADNPCRSINSGMCGTQAANTKPFKKKIDAMDQRVAVARLALRAAAVTVRLTDESGSDFHLLLQTGQVENNSDLFTTLCAPRVPERWSARASSMHCARDSRVQGNGSTPAPR
jgi:hypothetical protein